MLRGERKAANQQSSRTANKNKTMRAGAGDSAPVDSMPSRVGTRPFPRKE